MWKSNLFGFKVHNLWVKKTKTNHSSDTLLRIVLVFLTQTLLYFYGLK